MADSSQTNLETPAVFRSGRTGKNLTLVAERSAPTAQPVKDNLQAREATLKAKERDLQVAISVVRTGLAALSQRVLTAAALVATSVIFGVSAIDPSAWRLGTAIAFAVLVLLPLAYFDWSSRRP